MAINNALSRITTIKSRINQIKQRINYIQKSDFESTLQQAQQKINDQENKKNSVNPLKNDVISNNTNKQSMQSNLPLKMPKMSFDKNMQPVPASQRNPLASVQKTEQFNQQISKLSDEIGSIILDKSHQHEVDPLLISAIMAVESDFNPNALSQSGAMGLMQLMPGTANELGVHNPFNMTQNVDGGVKYFKMLLEKFSGDLKLALAAYNAGPNAVAKYGGVPPYEETQNYVVKVLGNYEKLLKQKQQVNTYGLPNESHIQTPGGLDKNMANESDAVSRGKVEIIKNMRETSEAIFENSGGDTNSDDADLF